jgi:hypothetical protein
VRDAPSLLDLALIEQRVDESPEVALAKRSPRRRSDPRFVQRGSASAGIVAARSASEAGVIATRSI